MNQYRWPRVQTTLMDVLAGRKTGGEIEGDIRVNVRAAIKKPLPLIGTPGRARLITPRITSLSRAPMARDDAALPAAGSSQSAGHLCSHQRLRGADGHPLASGEEPASAGAFILLQEEGCRVSVMLGDAVVLVKC